jgi:hypothetical protein
LIIDQNVTWFFYCGWQQLIAMEGAMHLHFRTIWILDTHLGGKNLKSKQLLDFLQKTDSDYLYLVGDIFDLWKLRSKWYWPEINDRIVNLV